MKHYAGTACVLVLLGLVFFTATGFAQSTGGKTEIKDDYVLVHPGVKLSAEDTQTLDDVLKTYDKSLYKIEVYNQGQVASSLGSLQDMCVDRVVVAEVMMAKAQGQSERAIQLIAPSSTANSATGSPTPPKLSPVNPQTLPVNPQMSPVNPQQSNAGEMTPSATPAGSAASAQASVNPQTGVNAQTAVNPQCAPTDPKAAEFLQRVKSILEKYSR